MEACRYVQSRVNLPNLEFVRDDVWNIETYGVFDATFCCGLFYHLDKPREFLDALSRVTKRVLILQTHFSEAKDSPSFIHPRRLRRALSRIIPLANTATTTHKLSFLTRHEGLPGRWFPEFLDPARIPRASDPRRRLRFGHGTIRCTRRGHRSGDDQGKLPDLGAQHLYRDKDLLPVGSQRVQIRGRAWSSSRIEPLGDTASLNDEIICPLRPGAQPDSLHRQRGRAESRHADLREIRERSPAGRRLEPNGRQPQHRHVAVRLFGRQIRSACHVPGGAGTFRVRAG